MDYKIESTYSADQDLSSIISYIAKDLDNATAAAQFLDQVDACYAHLEKMPFMYELCHDVRLRSLGYRKALINNYVMIYRVDEGTKTVYILRFFYGMRDYEKLI